MLITPLTEDKRLKYNIFLAGPIQGKSDWQSDLAKEFEFYQDVAFFSPRREEYDCDGNDYDEQIQWENEHLQYADLIVFCIPPKSANVQRYYEQETICQLSEWLQFRNVKKDVLVYVDDSFSIFNYINKRNPECIIRTQQELKGKIKEKIEEFKARKPRIFFTADTHFNQQRTLDYSINRRIFKDLNEMNSVLIENWNSEITNKDIVYHLGDFGDYEYRKFLKGNIRLILGNYEESDIKNAESIESIKNYGFESVQGNTILNINGLRIHLSHMPSKFDTAVDFNLFGHIHGRQQIKEFGLDVGVDAQNYAPIDLDTVLRFKDAFKYYDNEVWC